MVVERHKSESIYHDALLAFETENFPKAIDLLEQSLAHSAHYKAYELLGVILKRVGRSAESLVAFEQAHDLNPKSQKTACLLAQSLLGVHEVERAKGILEAVLKGSPSYGPAKRLLAAIQN